VKKRIHWMGMTVLILAMLLSACGGEAVTDVEPVATEAPVVSEEPVVFDPAELDAAFGDFLATVGGHTIFLDEFNTALASDTPPFILDVRDVEAAEKNGHISGAVLIPLRELAQNTAYLPSFDTTIVCYSKHTWQSSIALTILRTLGWDDVKVLSSRDNTDSYFAWYQEGYPRVEGVPPQAEMLNAVDIDEDILAHFGAVLANAPEAFGRLLAEGVNSAIAGNPDMILIDIRPQDNLEGRGVIDAPNLIFIPIEQFIEMKDMWPADTNARIIIVAYSSRRAPMAMTILWSNGYTNAKGLAGGFDGWDDAGYPVTEYTAP
jgi:rhodanese-related sulfurtransferase